MEIYKYIIIILKNIKLKQLFNNLLLKIKVNI